MNLSKNQLNKIKQIVGCEHNNCKKKDLEIHRINRCGVYSLRNIKILCHAHHKLYHSKEFPHISK